MGHGHVRQLTQTALTAGVGLSCVAACLSARPATVLASSQENSTGLSLVWRVDAAARGVPGVIGDTVFFLSRHHELFALAVDTGQVRWRRKTGSPGDFTGGARVVAAGQLAIVGDEDVIAYRKDGLVVWRYDGSGRGGPGYHLGEASNQTVFAGSFAGTVHAIDALTGVARWSRVLAHGRATVFAPVVHAGDVFVGLVDGPDSGRVVRLEASTGRVWWRQDFGDGAASPSAFGGGLLVLDHDVIASASDGRVHVFDRASGRRRAIWAPVGAGPAGIRAPRDARPLVRVGESIIAGSLSGVVVAYDRVTGTERWRRAPHGASVAFGLATDGEVVYVPYLAGPLVALDGRDGRERGRVDATGGGGFGWVPVWAHGMVFAAASGGGYFAFRPGWR